MKRSLIISLIAYSMLFGGVKAADHSRDLGQSENNAMVIPLWEEESPLYDNGLSENDETIVDSGWITLVTQPELIFYPASESNGITLLMCPGGGYYGLAIEHEGRGLSQPLNEKGINLAVLKYRMPNGHHEVPAEDARKALEILRKRASELGIDENKIGIGGASAGGHLASTVATHFNDSISRPDFQVLLYPVISMKEGITHQGSKDNLLGENPTDELISYYSNELQVNEKTPAAFIALSGNDGLVIPENSLSYYQALLKHGIPASMHIYPVGGHGWGVKSQNYFNELWLNELTEWILNLYPAGSKP
ncbi:MAG: alpha/beta hydrolase [Muribaculaceae bacterium]|nr:alpha/beta hydrolase [Muribaculaceae bacterium]